MLTRLIPTMMWIRSRFYNLAISKTSVCTILSTTLPIRAACLSANSDTVSMLSNNQHSKTCEKSYSSVLAQHRILSDKTLHKAVLSDLLSLAQSETARSVGDRYELLETDKVNEAIDNLLVKPLTDTLGLTTETALSLVTLVCSTDEQTLATIDPTVLSGTATRLSLLNPHHILVDLCDPLTHIGVAQPCRLITACPELILASAISTVSQATHQLPVGTKTLQRNQRARCTVFTEALDELTCLLPKKDVVRLISRYPNALLRTRDELTEIYAYLTDEMGLQTTEGVVLTRTNSYRHAMRHATGLKLVNCPAWSLPLTQIKMRHMLATLAGHWPLRSNKSWDSDSGGDRRLATILTCPAWQVSKSLLPPSDPTNGPIQMKGLLSGRDVRCFEAMCFRALRHVLENPMESTKSRASVSHSVASEHVNEEEEDDEHEDEDNTDGDEDDESTSTSLSGSPN